MKRILIGQKLYKHKLEDFNKKLREGYELTEVEKKQYRQYTYALFRLEKQWAVIKLLPLILGLLIFTGILNSLLSIQVRVLLISVFWLLTNYVVIMQKKDILKNVKYVDKIWLIFVVFGTVSSFLTEGLKPPVLNIIVFWLLIIYAYYYGRKVYLYGKTGAKKN